MTNFQVEQSVQLECSEFVILFCFPNRTEAEMNDGSGQIMGYEQKKICNHKLLFWMHWDLRNSWFSCICVAILVLNAWEPWDSIKIQLNTEQSGERTNCWLTDALNQEQGAQRTWSSRTARTMERVHNTAEARQIMMTKTSNTRRYWVFFWAE